MSETTRLLKEYVSQNPTLIVSRPHSIAGSCKQASTAMIAVPEPEIRGLTPDEIRRIVLDIIG